MSLSTLLYTVLGVFAVWRLTIGRKKPTPSSLALAAVAGPIKEHWLTGNFHRLFKDGLQYNLDLFKRYGGAIKVYGMLGAEQLLVYDPLALHHVLVKDQDSFEETDMFIETNKLLFGQGLISTLGDQHKKQRKMLNPVFSLANLRSVLPQIQPIADELVARLQQGLPADGKTSEVNVHPWLAKGTIEYVGRGILGAQLDCLEAAKASAYTDTLQTVQHVGMKVLYIRPFVPWAVRTFSQHWRNKLVDWLPFPALRELRGMAGIMHGSAMDIFASKKAEVERLGDTGDSAGDLMSIMLRANLSSQEKARLTDEELIGQINTFLLGGQETTTSALSRMLHILARETGAQSRLRSEVRRTKLAQLGTGAETADDWKRVSLPYDILVNLPFLDAVVRETLRLHPPTNMMNRVATRDTVLPLQHPVRSVSGEEATSVPVPKGTNVIISILGSNRNPRVWGEDADEWRPARWLTATGERVGAGKNADMEFGDESVALSGDGAGAGAKAGVVKYPGVYGGMMTFLGGNRACIGFKFAEMEIKQILSTLVTNIHFSLPSAVDEHGVRKEIYWRMDGLQVPVVREPHGDGKTTQVPLDIRLVTEADFA
ncbi:cytochrome P450 [Lenzites betulinus]|nr:cytochrome P450 [Lenzites betulinus]